MAKMTEVILPESSSVDSQSSNKDKEDESKAVKEEGSLESTEEKKDHVSDLAQTMEVQEKITTNADSEYICLLCQWKVA